MNGETHPPAEPAAKEATSLHGKRVLLGVTGSIAAYKACEIVSLFKKEGVDVHVILTKEATAFITPLTFQTVSRNKVITDMFECPEDWDPRHITLADKAALILIAPATANIIGKLATGICDDMLTCTVFAAKAPVLVAPAMNDRMYAAPLLTSALSFIVLTP